jgi:type I restriction-modification system DNA methylase subunit
MANERITEDIVRKHFNSYSNECIIEEQKSSNPKIDKLLKNASKKGGGKGHPEFIISLKNNTDFIIVVECKADITKHQSPTLDKYDEYAVDGALLYASFLSKEYDVLAIGVSGQNLKELKVSHYLYLKGEKKSIPIFGNKLLDIESYINGYLKNPEKFIQDYNILLDFSRKLNVDLHHHKIPEKDRALLISSILIALDDKAFRKAYKEYDKPEELAKFLVDTVSNVLRKANLNGKKLENLNIQFSFIRTDTSLSTNQGVLRNLTDSIDENINKFIKTHEYYDVLGQLYIEFLQYANSEKGLGIVLTPPHITELFCELAGVNKNSVVYDNCCGTGGFLISALRKMIKDAKDDFEKEKEIKTKQIIGVEYLSNIFALACSNMYIHQDGKTNIISGDCFDAEVMGQVKKYKPTMGFLNPPYKVSKEDIEELKFVLNNLEVLQPGGTCIAIVPMQCALAQKGEIYELKRRILQEHTLEAVLSMPDELFFNSDVGVVTCVMIFTAHKPHPSNKETYFGYYKDDGFVKRKIKGRIDVFGKWEDIKAEWVSSYINRKVKLGFSVNKIVSANDEWCAEAYMETDYSKLKKEDFVKILKEFVLFNELFLKKEK